MSSNSISVVIPVYNSQGCLDSLFERLIDVLNNVSKTYEIILVNDSSSDNSWRKIFSICKKSNKIKGINLSKNFGQDSAIMAGLNHSLGKIIVIMDDDLQHNPADIPLLLSEIEKGHDVCYARFDSKKQSWFKNFGSWFNDKVANIILKKPKEIYLSPYKAIKREVVDEIVKYDGPYPYVDGLLFRVTRNIAQVTVEHHERYAGEGNYNLRKSILVWLKLATNFSVFPLRIASFLGFFSSGIGFISAIFFIIQHFIGIVSPTGWPALIVTVLFLGGIQLVAIGLIGEYVGRLFLHHSKQPQFVVNEIIGESGDAR